MATPNNPRPAPVPQPANGSRPSGPPSPSPTAPKASRLGAVKRGLLREAKRFFFYGPEGVGKSSIAKDAGAIFIDTDRGSGHLDVERYTFRDGHDGHIPRTLDDIYAAVDDLLAADHKYTALAIDTTDALEQLIWAKIIKGAGVSRDGETIKTIEDFGFGKGYNIAASEWRVLMHRLDELRLKRSMHIILIGHVLVKTFKNPTGEDYDRFRPKLDDKALGLLREWCEVIGFVTFDDVAKKTKGANRAKGVTSGLRVVHLEHNAAWDAKTRLPLPTYLELKLERPFAAFESAIDALYMTDPDALRAAIDKELARLGDVFLRPDGAEAKAETTRDAVTKAGNDASTLIRYLTVLKQAQTKEATP
jgi:hypothetical protein